MTRTGGGARRAGAGGAASTGGIATGIPSMMLASCGSSISGGGGNSGCVRATLGRAAGGGGTNTRGGVYFRSQHEVLPNDNARMTGSSRDLAMVYRRRELEAEGSSPAQLARKVDSTIM